MANRIRVIVVPRPVFTNIASSEVNLTEPIHVVKRFMSVHPFGVGLKFPPRRSHCPKPFRKYSNLCRIIPAVYLQKSRFGTAFTLLRHFPGSVLGRKISLAR